ncbi:MAG: hypothetical protein HOW73_20445 [Polyangiaceae bacterium]|nr:hypothetical protein [Polyangiaceae bacterium]
MKTPRKPVLGPCDWCKAENKKRQPTRDHEEGLNGPVYYVCGDCVARRSRRLAEEDDSGDDWPDYDDDDDEREERPLAGCACENPLTVDTVCEACVAYMQEQDAEIERERLAKASAFTVEECVYWLGVAWAEENGYNPHLQEALSAAASREPEQLLKASHVALHWAGRARWEPDETRRDDWIAMALFAWRMCRETIRAIEREKEAMQRWG